MSTEPETLFDRIVDACTGIPKPQPHPGERDMQQVFSDLFRALPNHDLLAVIRLHRPLGQNYDRKVCAGCDNETGDSCSPSWPCRTAKLVAALVGVDGE